MYSKRPSSITVILFTDNHIVKKHISDKDYRLWFKLNEGANILVRTSVVESGTKLVNNSIGQGMFGPL